MANILVLLAFLELALCALLKSGPNGEDGLSPNDDYMQMALHHNEIKSFSRKRQSGSPVYTEGLSSSYFVNVTSGNNNQNIPLLLDTGSPPRYDPFDSATPKMQEKIFYNTYGTGSVLYRANLTNIGITLPNKTNVEFDPSMWRKNKTSLPVIFDMGTPTNLLPNNLYFVIGELYLDAVPYKHRLGFTAYKAPCDAPLGTFDYTFGSCTIKVSFLDSL
ncbi:hypothetical protein HBI46_140180 [Parastagonospora nodorum]|nr:hypothetical protein HBI62_119430 [Parastagonospora nodorum]KAH5413999.1 hypothetical protein HBI46_140180 [Parastagonospora nodorum]KAH6122584.1 hypothetical protein HBI69_059460 [Parastagonospora nodorum]KAH6149685.1 hypothetical protein HBI63_137790 [Parastagonospora nodorum]KAH6179845.1 hypothetical protein HBI61_103610 [Parastagonospora nodorum]